jgi:hypothetical protein
MHCCTSTFEFKDIVPVLVNTALCAILANPTPEKRNREFSILKNGEHLSRDRALMLTRDDYHWGKLEATVGQPITLPQSIASVETNKQTGIFVVVDHVGVGSTSRVFQALRPENGVPCLVKLIVDRSDGSANFLSKSDFETKSSVAAEKEVNNLKTLYDFSNDEVRLAVLNGLYAVVMPFFLPLTKEERRSDEVAKMIKVALENFYDKGLQHTEEDVCWRHIGWRDSSKQHIVIFDVADLVHLEKKDLSRAEFVDQQWTILQDRVDTET